jgi:hypothetical protein
MAFLTAYQRYRLLWGALDWQFGSESPYTNAQTGTNLGTSAAAGVGVGVRRCVLHVDRTGQTAGADDAEFHFDFLNLTGGTPDDTWTSSDYTTLEGYLDTFWAAIKGYVHPADKLAGYHWYRHGPGIHPPNPAERVTSRSVAGTSGSDAMVPQVASTITFRTAVRRSWGRTYLPALTDNAKNSGDGHLATAFCDNVCNAAAALLASAVGHDFPMVVTSVHLNAVLNVESLEVDNLADIQRRRRWRAPSYRKVLP